MTDRIVLRGVRCRARIGVAAAERRREQTVLLDLALGVDCRKAASSDDVRDTVDYLALERAVRALAGAREFRLVESLAESLARLALAFDARIGFVEVAVRKRPKAMPRTREVSIELRRLRPGR